MSVRERFSQLYQDYYSTIKAVCRQKTRNEADAEDLTQDAFAKALEQLTKVEGIEYPYAWLCELVNRLWCNKLRRKASSKELSLEEVQNALSVTDEGNNLSRELRKKEIIFIVNELSDDKRHLACLIMQGKTQEEIAKELGRPRTTVEYQIKKLCQELQPRLEKFQRS